VKSRGITIPAPGIATSNRVFSNVKKSSAGFFWATSAFSSIAARKSVGATSSRSDSGTKF
jgi:hypothetical protein